MQADFLARGASPLPGADQVVPAIAGLVAAFRSVGQPIVHILRLYQGTDVDPVRRSAIESEAQVVRRGTPSSHAPCDRWVPRTWSLHGCVLARHKSWLRAKR